MLTAAVATAYRRPGRDPDAPPEAVLREVDDELQTLARGEVQMAMTLVSIGEADRLLRWSCAGAPPLMVLRAGGGKILRTEPSSTPLGSRPLVVDSGAVALERGDRVLLLTDGVFEWTTAEGRPFGLRRVATLLEATRGMPLDDALAHMLARLAPDTLPDDMTFVLIDALA